jgi:hypothetical protein
MAHLIKKNSQQALYKKINFGKKYEEGIFTLSKKLF